MKVGLTEALVTELLEAPARRRKKLVARAVTRGAVVFAELKQRAEAAIGRDPQVAEHAAKMAFEVASATGQEALQASGAHTLGKVAHTAGDYGRALELYEQAVRGFRRATLPERVRSVELAEVDALFHLGKWAAADRLAARVRRAMRAAGDDEGEARLLVNLANSRHERDRHREAIRLLETARRVLRRRGDSRILARIDVNLANSWSLLARFDRSGPLYAAAARAYQELGEPIILAQVEYNLAYDHFLQGHLQEARRLLARARHTFDAQGARHHLALASLDEAEMALLVGNPDQALAAAELASREFIALGVTLSAARAQLFAGKAARALSDLPLASERFRLARAGFRRAGDVVGAASVDLAIVSGGGSGSDRARARRTLAVFRKAGLGAREALAQVVVGSLEAPRRPTVARRHLQRAMLLARRRGLPEVELRAQHAYGRLEERVGRPRRALVRYRLGIAAYERVRAGMRSDDDRLAFASDRQILFEDAIRCALVLGRVETAFELVEGARSRALVDLLAVDLRFTEAALYRGGPLARGLLRIKRKLAASDVRARERERRANPAAEGLGREAEDLLRAHEVAISRLGVSNPGESYAVAGWPRVPLGALRALLGSRVLVAYFVDRIGVGAIVLTERGLHAHRAIAARTEVDRALNALRFARARPYGMDPKPVHAAALAQTANAALSELHRLLVAPIERTIGDHAVVVVPPAALHWVPFPALSRSGRPWCSDREVSVSPSATVLALCQERGASPEGALVVSAPSHGAPAITREGHDVARRLAANVLDGAAATASNFARAVKGRRVIHLAAHGVFEPSAPLLSGLELADGRLLVPEIAALQLDAALVTLSACQTGLGALCGDEVLGVTRAFLHAGARSLVVSLWEVPDESTAFLMRHFYDRVLAGKGVAAALGEASLELQAVEPHPQHWAAFTVVGSWDPVFAASGELSASTPARSRPA